MAEEYHTREPAPRWVGVNFCTQDLKKNQAEIHRSGKPNDDASQPCKVIS